MGCHRAQPIPTKPGHEMPSGQSVLVLLGSYAEYREYLSYKLNVPFGAVCNHAWRSRCVEHVHFRPLADIVFRVAQSIFDPKRTWGLIWRSIEGCPGVGIGGCGGSPGGGAGCGGSPGGIGLCLVVVMTAPHLWLKSRETPESRKRQIRCHPGVDRRRCRIP
jgi:hypothetical protein